MRDQNYENMRGKSLGGFITFPKYGMLKLIDQMGKSFPLCKPALPIAN